MKTTIPTLLTALITVFLLNTISPARGQTTTLSLDEVLTCPDSDISIALYVENLFNAGAISLYIGYDTAVLEYDGHSHVHPQFMSILTNAVTTPATQVNIIWTNQMGASIQSDTLLVLNFNYKNGNSELTFNPGGEITNIHFAPILFDGINGSVLHGPPYIDAHPQFTVVTEGNPATFSVTATGADTYQWQEFDGEDWQNLQESAIYQNVNSPELTITETTLEMDSLLYRCFMNSIEYCEAYSDSAMLTVLPELTAMLTLSNISFCPGQQVEVPLTGYALDDVIEFAFYISYLPLVAEFVGLSDVHPLIEGTVAQTFTSPVPHIKIFWSASIGVTIPDGKLFDLVFNYTQSPAPLVFMDQTFVLSAGLFNYNLSLINGQITTLEHPIVVSHPADTLVIPGTIAQFSVTGENTNTYHWYESQDDGETWAPLQNIAPYAGVLTPVLSIAPVTSAFYGHQYKCKLTGQFCEAFSNAATLTVDTVSSVQRIQADDQFRLQTYISTRDRIELSFHIPVSGALSIRLYDLTGRLVYQKEHQSVPQGILHTYIEKGNLFTGILLMKTILQGSNYETYLLNRKLLTL